MVNIEDFNKQDICILSKDSKNQGFSFNLHYENMKQSKLHKVELPVFLNCQLYISWKLYGLNEIKYFF